MHFLPLSRNAHSDRYSGAALQQCIPVCCLQCSNDYFGGRTKTEKKLRRTSRKENEMNFDLLTGFVRDIRSARRAANEFERLNRMNTSELANLGIDRSQISSYAFNKHFKQR